MKGIRITLLTLAVLLCGIVQVRAEIKNFDSWTSDNTGVDNSTSTNIYTIEAPVGATLSFDWSVSSESGYDELIVTLDGEQVLGTSGERNGTFVREIGPGQHILKAEYIKDASSNQGDDRATLSNVKISYPDVAVIDGISYSSTNSREVTVLSVSDTTEVAIPATVVINNVTYNVTEIASTAFSACTSLTNVTIPNSVTEIKNNTFEGCINLTTINLPNTLTTIGSSVFKGCTSLANITIPSTVTSIGSSAFQGCTSLESVVVPNNVTSIASRLFSECTNLKSVVIPNTIIQIGEYAFYNCGNMESVTIPKSVNYIAYRAFEGCGGELIVNCRITSSYFENSKFTKATIGEGVTSIGYGAFRYVSTLIEVILPSTLTDIGEGAFYGTNLSSIELPAAISNIGYDAFPSSMSRMTCNSTTPPTLQSSGAGSMPTLGNISIVYVPQGCKAAYKNVNPWASKVIVDGSGVAVNVTVTPGMMGEEILKQANYLADVNFLTLSGAINDVDIANIKNSMPNLLTIDMAGVDMKTIPSEMFFNRKALLSIILPKNVESIQYRAFYNCINLESIVLPEGLKRISSDGCFEGCSSLKSVLFPSSLEYLGSYAFSNCTSLQKVEIKEGITSIGTAAFSNCYSLSDLTLPKTLKSIPDRAFYNCISLKTVIIPEGVTSIGERYEYSGDYGESGAFAYCSSLRQIILPNGLEEICKNSFSGCYNLTNVQIPEGVKFIGKNAFSGCTNLVSVSFPSTLASCSSTPFAGCNKLSEVTCMALLPPMLSDGLLTLENMGLALKRTLKVPEWTINRYKLTSGWAAFTQIEPINGVYPSTISVVGDAVLTMPAAGLPANYKPEMVFPDFYADEMMYGGISSSLHLRGAGTLNLSNFVMHYQNSMYHSVKQLLNEEATIIADSVTVNMSLESTYYNDYNNQGVKWHFLSFPYDVKLSDVVTNCDWVVREYDGKARANNKLSSTWATVPYDATLQAGKGYIWACSGGSFTIPAVDNANKNNIFSTIKCEVPLQEYVSDVISNSGWNLVGNPFPCYYNTNEMDFTAPITVWDSNNNTYAAYSPVDDHYVLSPFEAFFVQCPIGVKSIGFNPEGRQLTATNVETAAPSRSRDAETSRLVINLKLSNEHGTDRTRVVVNDAAKMDYELSCDAAKFMSDDAMAQLYTVCGKEMYSINERPMSDGIVKLGTQFAKTGIYTIAMESNTDKTVVLVDFKTGLETILAERDYTFHAEADDTDRFEVRIFDSNVTGIETAKVNTKVVAMSGCIVVSGAMDAKVAVYNAAGVLIATDNGRNLTFDVAPGVYLVKVNGVSYKVAVAK